MKKGFYILLLLFALNLMSLPGIAQEKGPYLSLTGNTGSSNLRYALDNGNQSKAKLGYGGSIGYQYFFTPNWGISTGLGLDYYASSAKYAASYQTNSLFEVKNMIDNDFDNPATYNTLYQLNNWKEKQEAYLLEIPLKLNYQKRWVEYRDFGVYTGLGCKLQMPVFSQKYSVQSGSELTVWGYYPKWDVTFGKGPNIIHSGFGSNENISDEAPYTNQKLDLKTGVALAGDLGVIFRLRDGLDLTLGAYLDYGLTTIKKGNKNPQEWMLSPTDNEHHTDNKFIGDYTNYNGMINSSIIKNGRVIPFSVGLKFGLQVHL